MPKPLPTCGSYPSTYIAWMTLAVSFTLINNVALQLTRACWPLHHIKEPRERKNDVGPEMWTDLILNLLFGCYKV
jgi:hypothetical protein